MAETMKKILIEGFGSTDEIQLKDVSQPHAKTDEVRVKVKYVSLNAMDWYFFRNEQGLSVFHLSFPISFGSDFSGVVDEVGEEVSDFKVGDRVLGMAVAQAGAEYLIVNPKSAQRALVHTPDSVSDKIAATVPVPGGTADAALRQVAIKAGDIVLVGGAAGGVGVYVVQMVRLLGATVIGTCSESTFDFVRALGATPVKYGEGLAERVKELAPDGIDAAISLVGNETVDVALKLGVPADKITTIVPGRLPEGVVWSTGGTGDIAPALTALEKSQMQIPIASIFPIEKAREAAELLKSGHVHGKILIEM